jgi:hypothetical protein
MRMMLRTHIAHSHRRDRRERCAEIGSSAKGNLGLHREVQARGNIFRPRKRQANRLFRLRHGRLAPMPRGRRGVFRHRLRCSSVAVHDPGRSSNGAGGRGISGARLMRCQDWRSPLCQPQDHIAVGLARGHALSRSNSRRAALQGRGCGYGSTPSNLWLRPGSQFHEAFSLCQSRHAHRCPQGHQQCDHHCDDHDEGFDHRGSPVTS